MGNKVSRGVGLRIKSPQALPAGTPVKAGVSAPHLRKSAGKRSENGSAVRALPQSAGLAIGAWPACDVWLPLESDPTLGGYCTRRAGHHGSHLTRTPLVHRDAEAGRPEAPGGAGAEPPSGFDPEMPLSWTLAELLRWTASDLAATRMVAAPDPVRGRVEAMLRVRAALLDREVAAHEGYAGSVIGDPVSRGALLRRIGAVRS